MEIDSDRIRDNLQLVRSRIEESARRSGRDPGAVSLVAVTKKNPVAMIRPLVALGVVELGENYPQELWRKVDELVDVPVRWHLIGHLQGNKARKTLPMVRMIHSVDSLKLLRELGRLAADMGGAELPEVCLQVNTSGEAAKHGWSPETVLEEAEAIAEVRGLPV
ncbi:YggS family pyridoxal phosphate enzyme, partial [Singulisphaera rosea]